MNKSYENENQVAGNQLDAPATSAENNIYNQPTVSQEAYPTVLPAVAPVQENQKIANLAVPVISQSESGKVPSSVYEPVVNPTQSEQLTSPVVEPVIAPLQSEVLNSSIVEPVIYHVQGEESAPLEASNELHGHSVPGWSFSRRARNFSMEAREPTYREPAYRMHDTSVSNMYTPGLNTYGRTGHLPRKREAHLAPPAPQKRKSKIGGFLRAVCLIVVCALVSAGATYAVMEYRIREGHMAQAPQVVLGGSISGQGAVPAHIVPSGVGMSGAEIYQMALTQVVGISIDVPTTGLFGSPGINTAAGSGFIIREDGYILTNHHVIEPGLEDNLPINVIFNDGTQYIATVVGYEVANDVALLKIDANGLSASTLVRDFGTVEPGQRIYAIGNPLGSLHHTMTGGLVSAVGRTVTVEGTIINAFQFDAAVNRGNSGGPIYNEFGEVVGIVTAKLARSDVEGIGFAIPISDAYEIASGLMSYGYIPGRSLLGLVVENFDLDTDVETVLPFQAEYLDLVVGARVRSINPGSAAERAGLRVGDIIIGLGDAQVVCINTLRFAMRSYRAGETAIMSVWRAGTIYELEVTFDEDLAAGQPGRNTQPTPTYDASDEEAEAP